ncbi:MAG: hypothetical protein SFX74_05105 [Fimbriimonadaceae bacterium]|nr:hypothetical protein [Fimbriimonadaceae bacterium]
MGSRYTVEEASKIIQRASAIGDSETLTRDDLLRVASELGISQSALAEAMAEADSEANLAEEVEIAVARRLRPRPAFVVLWSMVITAYWMAHYGVNPAETQNFAHALMVLAVPFGIGITNGRHYGTYLLAALAALSPILSLSGHTSMSAASIFASALGFGALALVQCYAGQVCAETWLRATLRREKSDDRPVAITTPRG